MSHRAWTVYAPGPASPSATVADQLPEASDQPEAAPSGGPPVMFTRYGRGSPSSRQPEPDTVTDPPASTVVGETSSADRSAFGVAEAGGWDSATAAAVAPSATHARTTEPARKATVITTPRAGGTGTSGPLGGVLPSIAFRRSEDGDMARASTGERIRGVD